MNINEIATMANQIKKPTKQELHGLVKDLVQTGVFSDDRQAAMFYAYFLPPDPTKGKGVAWVARAMMGKKDSRRFFRALHSDGSHLYATDGHRAHRMPTNLPPGYYDKNLTKIEVGRNWPDIGDRFFGSRRDEVEVRLNPGDLPVVERAGFTAYRIDVPNGKPVFVQKKYLDDAANRELSVKVFILDPVSVIRGVHDNGAEFVIMPMRGE